MAKRHKSLSEQFKFFIRNSGVSQYRIAKETGLDPSSLSNFLAGRRGMALDNVDKVGKYLGLRFVQDRKPKVRK